MPQNFILDNGISISKEEGLAILTHYLQNSDIIDANSNVGLESELISKSILNRESEKDNTVKEEFIQYNLFPEIRHARFKPSDSSQFKFIDLFAGIGGFRIAMQNVGGRCVFSSEFDENAKKTYYKNFGDIPFGDITLERTKSYIPDNFDVLCAGFPCQAFSIAGYRKGFEDTRGTLFFDVAEIIRRKRPKAIFLENVKNLYSHDNGNTFKIIKNTLEDLGYVVYHKILNSLEYANIPQNRERIFIICFDPKQVPNYGEFTFPEALKLSKKINDCIDYSLKDEYLFYDESMMHYSELKSAITSKSTIYQWRRQYVRENKSNVCPTLTANMGTGGHNVPLILTDTGIRKLSPKECINFQGYPEDYVFPENLAKSAMYKQAGNSVVVPLIERVCRQITSILLPHS